MRKYDIVNALNRKYGYTRFLEISTPTTGFTFGQVNTDGLGYCHRLVYNCGAYHDDGQAFTYRSSSLSSHDLLLAIDAAPTRRYDSIFLDPHHTSKATAVDLTGAFALLADGGAIVVHDCSPADPEIVGPAFKVGAWCGVTYAAFIDFVTRRADLTYYTVDCDHGCGVVLKRPPTAAERPATTVSDRLLLEWEICREEDEARYALFDAHRTALLNLIPVEAFLAREASPAPAAASAPCRGPCGQGTAQSAS